MAVVFSRVSLLADNGSTEDFLVGGIPESADDLEGWTAYENFLEDNPDAKDIDINVSSYQYGEGEVLPANVYEVAAFTLRGERFLTHPDVHLTQTDRFIILLDQEESEEMEELS